MLAYAGVCWRMLAYAGGLHSLALCALGHVYTWGCNTKGQCGIGGEEEDVLLMLTYADV
jgi:alpha-tubulin suppressor-like RCC1 family protein